MDIKEIPFSPEPMALLQKRFPVVYTHTFGPADRPESVPHPERFVFDFVDEDAVEWRIVARVARCLQGCVHLTFHLGIQTHTDTITTRSELIKRSLQVVRKLIAPRPLPDSTVKMEQGGSLTIQSIGDVPPPAMRMPKASNN